MTDAKIEQETRTAMPTINF